MEELSNMLNRLLHRGDEEEIRQDELKKQIDAHLPDLCRDSGP